MKAFVPLFSAFSLQEVVLGFDTSGAVIELQVLGDGSHVPWCVARLTWRRCVPCAARCCVLWCSTLPPIILRLRCAWLDILSSCIVARCGTLPAQRVAVAWRGVAHCPSDVPSLHGVSA